VEARIEEHAPRAVVEGLRQLPDRTYHNVGQVWEALDGGQRLS